MPTTYNVRVFKIDVYEGKKLTSYYVRWRTGPQKHCSDAFRQRAAAESFRSELVTAASLGQAFDVESGLPLAKLAQAKADKPWFEVSKQYADERWQLTSASHRQNTAHVLMTITMQLCRKHKCPYPLARVRTALREWAYNKERRKDAPTEMANILAWVERSSPTMAVWTDSESVAGVLVALATKLDGKPCATSSMRRDRNIASHMLRWAVERKLLEAHPFTLTKPARIKSSRAVDKRSVPNEQQIDRLLNWISARPRNGACLFTVFSTMRYAGLRPEEAVSLRLEDVRFPEVTDSKLVDRALSDPEADIAADVLDRMWGEITVHAPTPEPGSQWTDSGKPRETRDRLKGRDAGQSRTVPAHPLLCRILREYVDNPNPRAKVATPIADGARLFTGEHGGDLAGSVMRRNWGNARDAVLTEHQRDSPLAQTSYSLRHYCLTTWIDDGVRIAQVALWAGNSVAVLNETYIGWIEGTDADARRRALQQRSRRR